MRQALQAPGSSSQPNALRLEEQPEVQGFGDAVRADVGRVAAVLSDQALLAGPRAERAHGRLPQPLAAEFGTGEDADIHEPGAPIAAGRGNQLVAGEAAESDLVGHLHVPFVHIFRAVGRVQGRHGCGVGQGQTAQHERRGRRAGRQVRWIEIVHQAEIVRCDRVSAPALLEGVAGQRGRGWQVGQHAFQNLRVGRIVLGKGVRADVPERDEPLTGVFVCGQEGRPGLLHRSRGAAEIRGPVPEDLLLECLKAGCCHELPLEPDQAAALRLRAIPHR